MHYALCIENVQPARVMGGRAGRAGVDGKPRPRWNTNSYPRRWPTEKPREREWRGAIVRAIYGYGFSLGTGAVGDPGREWQVPLPLSANSTFPT